IPAETVNLCVSSLEMHILSNHKNYFFHQHNFFFHHKIFLLHQQIVVIPQKPHHIPKTETSCTNKTSYFPTKICFFPNKKFFCTPNNIILQKYKRNQQTKYIFPLQKKHITLTYPPTS